VSCAHLIIYFFLFFFFLAWLLAARNELREVQEQAAGGPSRARLRVECPAAFKKKQMLQASIGLTGSDGKLKYTRFCVSFLFSCEVYYL